MNVVKSQDSRQHCSDINSSGLKTGIREVENYLSTYEANNQVNNTDSKAVDKRNVINKVHVNYFLNLYCQNVKSINCPLKKEYFKNLIQEEKLDILILTKTWESDATQFGSEKLCRNMKVLTARGKKDTYKGQGITVFVKYPLAQHIVECTKHNGRFLRIIFRHKKKRPLALYTLQCPTAPYNEGAPETKELTKLLQKWICKDLNNGYNILIAGDINSYSNSEIDYQGTSVGQKPSLIIQLFERNNMTDIYRLFNPDSKIFTFKSTKATSRLDNYWVSSGFIKDIVETKIDEFNSNISDHAGIYLKCYWKHKAVKSLKFDKT